MRTLAFIISAANSFLFTYVLLDIAHLFDVPYLTSLTYSQMFGLLFVIGFLKLSLHIDMYKELTDEESLRKSLTNAVMSLIGWGIAYLYSFVL